MKFIRVELTASDGMPSGKWAPETLALSQLCEMLTIYQNVTLTNENHSEFALRCDVANRDAVEFAIYRPSGR